MRPHRMAGFLMVVGLVVLYATFSTTVGHAADGAWRELNPPCRRQAAGLYDPLRDRYLVFGGRDSKGSRNEVWVFSPGAGTPWQQLPTIGTPPTETTNAIALLDASRDRALFIVGETPSGFEVWSLTLGTAPAWSRIATTAGGPVQRRRVSAVLDPVGDRILVFGGFGPHPTFGDVNWNETWALSLAGTPTWQLIQPAGTLPPISAGASAAYDAAGRRMIVDGGTSVLWALSLDPTPSWAQIPVTGGPALIERRIIVDAPRARVVLEGYREIPERIQMWTVPLTGGTYAQLLPASSAGDRKEMAFLQDTARSRFVLVWGLERTITGPTNDRGPYVIDDATWVFDLAGTAGWTELGPPIRGMNARSRGLAIRDPLRPRLLVFSGNDAAHRYGGALPIQHDLTADDGWTPFVAAAGSPLPAEEVTARAFDRKRSELWAWERFGLPLWILDLATDTWRTRTATNSPTGNFRIQGAAVDSVHDRLVVIGVGRDPTFQVDITTVWTLSLTDLAPTWIQLEPAGTNPRYAMTSFDAIVVPDGRRDRMLFFGDGNQVWELALNGTPTWTQLPNLPTFFYAPTAAYDPASDRLLLFYADFIRTNLTWLYTWPLGAPPSAATRLFPAGIEPRPGSAWFGAFDPPTNRLMLIGGENGFWQYESVASPPPPPVLVGCPGNRSAAPGERLDLVFQLGPLASGGTLDYVLSSQRTWPGLPLAGAATLGPGEVFQLPLTVVIPDSAAGGMNRLRLAATLRGAGTAGSCDAFITLPTPPPVPAVDLACAPAVTSIPGGTVRGHFQATVTGTSAPTLDWVATSTRAWPGFPLTGSVPIGGSLAVLDLDVPVPDTARVGRNDVTVTVRPAGESVADSCTWAIVGPGETPLPVEEFAVRVTPNPSSSAVGFALGLAHDTSVRVEIRGLATGRLAFRREFGRLEAGAHALDLVTAGTLPPGVYAVRFFLDGFTRLSKLVVLP